MTGFVSVTYRHHRSHPVGIARDGDVDPTFWLSLQAHWDHISPRPARELNIALEDLVREQSWFAKQLKRYDVSVNVTLPISIFLQRYRDIKNDLRDIQTGIGSEGDLEFMSDPMTRFRGDLTPFQLRDVSQLLAVKNGANFSVPGAGKTASCLAVYETERLRGRVDTLLVICPISAFEAWQEESQRWLHPAPAISLGIAGAPDTSEILLINYQRLEAQSHDIAQLASTRRVHLVLDEAHRIKRGRAGVWGSQALNLSLHAFRRDVLTGTPVPNQPADLLALIDFCWPYHARRILPRQVVNATPNHAALVQMAEAIAPIYVRTTKQELGLPPLSVRTREVEMGQLQAYVYSALRSTLHSEIVARPSSRAEFIRMGRIVMYLLEASTNPALLPAGSSAADAPEYLHPPLTLDSSTDLLDLLSEYSKYEIPRKFAVLREIVVRNSSEGLKTLVWSNFVRNLEYLHGYYLHDFSPALIHGGIPSDSTDKNREGRIDAIKRFRRDPNCSLLLANPAAIGEGISLHMDCHDAVYLDRTFNAGTFLQSIDRIHRLGLPPDTLTNVTILQSANSIDQIVGTRLETKIENMRMILDDPGLSELALPVDDPLSDEKLEGLDAQDVALSIEHLMS